MSLIRSLYYVRVHAGQPCRITGRQIQGKGLQQTPKSGLTDLGVFVVPIFPLIHRSKRMLACDLLSKTLMR